jgi:lipopolysaccharide transport system ATP-binding protein
MSTVLSVSGLSKKYSADLKRSLRYGLADAARELAPWRGGGAALRRDEFWALEDVSFTLEAGRSLAIVGRNGAGKSTLLRILSGLLKPDRGEVRIGGRTSELIELGTGFSPVLSGRENLLAGAALHGITGRAARSLVDSVVDFSELGKFIDSAVQTYSSGMKARLGYALAAQLAPDLLLVDEVLAVGDHAFQQKCLSHMRSYLDGGGSLLLVSHNMFQIQAVCEQGLLLEGGRAVFQGSAVEALERMYREEGAGEGVGGDIAAGITSSSGAVSIEGIAVEGPEGGPVRTGAPLQLRVRYRCHRSVETIWGFSLWTGDQWVCVAGETDERPRRLEPGAGELACVVPSLPLLPGRYFLRLSLADPATWHPHLQFGWNGAGLAIEVTAEPGRLGNTRRLLQQLVQIETHWE